MEGLTMAVTFKRFDVADHLTNEDDIAGYLDAVNAEGDPAAIVAALSDVARARNMTRLARDADITREGLYKALSPDGNPSFATVARVAEALGMRLSLVPIATRSK
jgi:probable addiction module antidote protein